MYNWQPDMKIGNRLYEKDGAQWWETEIAMSLADLQMPVPNKVGDRVKILMSHDGKNPGWTWSAVPSASGYLMHHGFPRGLLTDAQPYAQIEKLTGLADEKIAFKSAVYNPSKKPVRVHALLRIANEGKVGNDVVTKVVVNEDRTLEIPAGGMARFDVDKEFPGLDYGKQMQGVYDMRLTLADDPAAEPVLSHHHTFRKDSEKTYLKYTPRPLDFQMSVKYNPASHAVWVEADTLDAKVPAEQLSGAEWAIKRGDAEVARGRLDQKVYEKYQGLAQLPALAPGKYTVMVSLLDKAGKPALTRKTEIEKKDEAKEFPEWWGKTYGDPEQVLKPFEALRAKGSSVTVTRRVYELDSLGLPMQITANGGSVLTAPARMVLVIDGREYVVPAKPGVKFVEKKDWRHSFEGEPVEVAGVKFSAKGIVEQDGLVSLELTYAPTGKPVEIQKLRIEWPVDDTWNNHHSCIGVGGNFSARSIGAVPPRQGVAWSTLKNIGKAGSGMTVGNFYQNLWLGTEKRGLLWWANSDEGWVPDDGIAAHEIAREGKTTVLRNNLIGMVPGRPAFALAKPRSVKFSYNASPFRSLTKGWRLNQSSYCDGFGAEGQGPKGVKEWKRNWDTGMGYFSIISPPFPDPKRWPEYYAWCKAQVDKMLPAAVFNPGVFN